MRFWLPALICCIITFHSSFAQETPKTLLWRISGNGFTKPCYLYGTMHTKDKRAYYLGDSVYSTIKFCDGFAMEVDPAETVDTILTNNENAKLDIEYRKMIENDIVEKGPDYYKKRTAAFDSVLMRMRTKFRNMSTRQIYRLERAYRRRMKNDMRTRLDLYLFDLAKTQGKVVGAVEDLVDQTSIKYDDKPFDEDAFLAKQKGNYADFMEWMIETYAAAELDKIHSMSKASQSPYMQTVMLYNRNDKMARRIDSLGKIRSTFCAVGSAHLPGDSGVIDLLRRRGFLVEPVFSNKKIEPGDVLIENKLVALTEVSDADSNFVVMMPGKPTDYTYITNKLMVKAYKELSNDILMMCGVYEDGKTYKTVAKLSDEIKEFFSEHRVKLYETEKILRQGVEGIEMTFRNHDGYMRMHFFCNNGKTYMFGAGSKEKDSMYSVRCDNYLASYKMFLTRARSESSFSIFSDAENAFSVAMPTNPKKENINGDVTYTNEEVTLFTSVDTKSKTNYLTLIKQPNNGYFPGFDSSIFKQTLSEIGTDLRKKFIDDEENTMLDGQRAIKVRMIGEADNKRHIVYVVMAQRHHRFYCVVARGLNIPENEKLFDNYFNSFKFLPYLKPSFKSYKVPNLFSVKTISAITFPEVPITTEDSTKQKSGASLTREYFAFDTATATTYMVNLLFPGKYYWAPNEQALLNEYAGYFFNSNKALNNIAGDDSLVYNNDVNNGTAKAKELFMQNVHNGSCTRIRILHYGDSVFVLNMKGHKQLLTDAAADSFFTSFRVANPGIPTSTFLSKTKSLVDNLQSKDSLQCAMAMDALSNRFKFPAADIGLLLTSLLYKFPVMKSDINELVAGAIAKNVTDEVVPFIKTHYSELKGKRENIRMLMFNILAANKTTASYTLIKDLWLNDQPSPANYSIALQHYKEVPALAATFFPDLFMHIKIRDMAPDVLDLASMLIDSGYLKFESLKEYEEDILRIAKKMLEQYQDNNYEEYYVPHVEALVKLLVKINNKKANNMLEDFSSLQNHGLKLVIMLEMAKNEMPLPTDYIDRFSEDPVRRIELYDELFKAGKQAFFKGRYANQKAFAEAFASMLTNDQIPARIVKDYDVAAIKEELFNGKPSRFYVMKVKCHFVYENISYTCIIGPFDASNNNLSIPQGKDRFILYREKFQPEEVDRLYNDYMNKIRKIK